MERYLRHCHSPARNGAASVTPGAGRYSLNLWSIESSKEGAFRLQPFAAA